MKAYARVGLRGNVDLVEFYDDGSVKLMELDLSGETIVEPITLPEISQESRQTLLARKDMELDPGYGLSAVLADLKVIYTRKLSDLESKIRSYLVNPPHPFEWTEAVRRIIVGEDVGTLFGDPVTKTLVVKGDLKNILYCAVTGEDCKVFEVVREPGTAHIGRAVLSRTYHEKIQYLDHLAYDGLPPKLDEVLKDLGH